MQYYLKGWSDNVGEEYSTFGTVQYNDISLPASNLSLQVSSSDSNDTCVVLVSGQDDSWNDVVATVTLTGQAPVTLGAQFYRINSMRVISEEVNKGNIFLSRAGSLLFNGCPAAQSNYYYSVKKGDKVSAIANLFVDPVANGFLKPTRRYPQGRWHLSIINCGKQSGFFRM